MSKICRDYITEVESFINLSEGHHKTTKLFLIVLWIFQVFNIGYVGLVEIEVDFILLIIINSVIIFLGQKQYNEENYMLKKMRSDFFMYKSSKVLSIVEFNRINNQE